MTKRQNDYAKKLQDPRWQRKRLEVMQSANWACVICGDKDEELNVHHPSYNSHMEPWEFSNLQCICRTCHTIYHLPKEKLMIHARSLVTEHIFVRHEQQFLGGLEDLIRSMARNDPKYATQLFTIKGLALDEYESLKTKTQERIDDVLNQFSKDQGIQ